MAEAIEAGRSKLAEFERRIDAGEFDRGGFHRFVQREIYPLLAEGALTEEEFARLVKRWSSRVDPYNPYRAVKEVSLQ